MPSDKLHEHYSSPTHQTILLRLIKDYVCQLHQTPATEDDHVDKGNVNLEEVCDTLNTLAEGLSCLTDDNLNNFQQVIRLQNHMALINEQNEKLKKSIDEYGQCLEAAQINHNVLQTEMESIKQTLADCASASTNDGSFIWKITSIAEKIQNAMSDRQTSIYSPPFYTSPTGYKICMRLYLNGDGQARRTHLSLFFVIMRGDYDAILPWPFAHKINFCLYDQTGNQRHIIDSFRPDVKSNSFQRPRSNMNIASGIPKFFPVSMIQQDNNAYVRDDCMFIRCIVDMTAMPKTVLPFMLCLNPALPISTQYSAIQAEIQKQSINSVSVSNSEMKIEENAQNQVKL